MSNSRAQQALGFFWCAQHGPSLGGEAAAEGCKSSTGPTGGTGQAPPVKSRYDDAPRSDECLPVPLNENGGVIE